MDNLSLVQPADGFSQGVVVGGVLGTSPPQITLRPENLAWQGFQRDLTFCSKSKIPTLSSYKSMTYSNCDISGGDVPSTPHRHRSRRLNGCHASSQLFIIHTHPAINGNRLPQQWAIREVAVTTCQVQPFDHTRFQGCQVLPFGRLVRFETGVN